MLVWGYNASFSSLIGEQPSSDRIHHHAQTLVANLGAERRVSITSTFGISVMDYLVDSKSD